MSDSYVYVLAVSPDHGDANPPVKVGITSDPHKRYSAIRTASPFPIRMQMFFGPMTREQARDVERAAHDTYRYFRWSGEWFNVEPRFAISTLADIISALCIGKVDDVEYAKRSSALGVAAANMVWDPLT